MIHSKELSIYCYANSWTVRSCEILDEIFLKIDSWKFSSNSTSSEFNRNYFLSVNSSFLLINDYSSIQLIKHTSYLYLKYYSVKLFDKPSKKMQNKRNSKFDHFHQVSFYQFDYQKPTLCNSTNCNKAKQFVLPLLKFIKFCATTFQCYCTAKKNLEYCSLWTSSTWFKLHSKCLYFEGSFIDCRYQTYRNNINNIFIAVLNRNTIPSAFRILSANTLFWWNNVFPLKIWKTVGNGYSCSALIMRWKSYWY